MYVPYVVAGDGFGPSPTHTAEGGGGGILQAKQSENHRGKKCDCSVTISWPYRHLITFWLNQLM
jgi:hypothetical protein